MSCQFRSQIARPYAHSGHTIWMNLQVYIWPQIHCKSQKASIPKRRDNKQTPSLCVPNLLKHNQSSYQKRPKYQKTSSEARTVAACCAAPVVATAAFVVTPPRLSLLGTSSSTKTPRPANASKSVRE